MRFSSIFHSSPKPRRDAPREEERVPEADASEPAAPVPPVQRPALQQQQQPQAPTQPPAQELPDDLDARVRLIGEWQLGEG